MPQRDGYIPGVPCWVDTAQPDPDGAAAFYDELFGWEFEDVMPPDAPGRYLVARMQGGDVAAISSQRDASRRPVWNTYVWVASADETAATVRSAGGDVLQEPFDVLDAGRMAVLADPEGAEFCAWQAKRHRGAQIVNEPGSVNFNNLHTRDTDRAASFYGAVFGWEILEFGGAGGAWRLPGYGDFLEQSDPELRPRMKQVGAPPGFEDAVATLAPIAADESDSARWSVTFAVEDADAVATRAAQLGGEVLAAPFDAPWVRTTVIADPQGAAFTASQFVPENRDLVTPGEPGLAAA